MSVLTDGHKSPIFIIGSGRSGTTLFYNALISHEKIDFFRNWENIFPILINKNIEKIFSYFFRYSVSSKFCIETVGIDPNEPSKECGRIFDDLGFKELGLPVFEESNPRPALRLGRKISDSTQKVEHIFALKNTNNGLRVCYLKKNFPEAVFIHIIRDGRANVYSYLNTEFFYRMPFWWADNQDLESLEKQYHSLVEIAALHWKHNVEEVLRQARSLAAHRYLELKYEELTEHPQQVFQQVMNFCGLEYTNGFARNIENMDFENRNYKWQQGFDEDQKAICLRVLTPLLTRLGYLHE